MYEEEQKFSLSLFLGVALFIVLLATLASWFVPEGERLTVLVGAVSPAVFVLLLYRWLKLRTVVNENKLSVKLAPFGGIDIPLADITNAQAVEYNPIRDFGGWGIRFGRKGRMYNARGNRAVQFDVKDRGRIFVGSQTPEQLVAILSARR